MASKLTDQVIGVAIALLIAVAIMASALTSFFTANTSGWNTSVIAVWGLLAILAVLSVALGFYHSARSGK